MIKTTLERIYEDSTDTAKKIRKALKVAFPAIKFSVRTSKYSGGSSIDISYTDGVLKGEVEAVVDQFSSGSFNGMEDIYETSGYIMDGKLYVGAKYLFVRRDLSPEYKLQIQAKAADMNEGFEIGCWGYPQMMDRAEIALLAPEAPAAPEYTEVFELTDENAIEAIVVAYEEGIISSTPAALKYIPFESEYISPLLAQFRAEAEEDALVEAGLKSGFIVDLMLYRQKKGIA